MSCAFRFEANPVNASQLIPVIVGSLWLGSLRCSVMSSSLEWFIPTLGLFGGHQWHVIHHIISHLLSFIVHHFLGMCSPQLQLVDCQHHTWLATDALNHAVRCSKCRLFDLSITDKSSTLGSCHEVSKCWWIGPGASCQSITRCARIMHDDTPHPESSNETWDRIQRKGSVSMLFLQCRSN